MGILIVLGIWVIVMFAVGRAAERRGRRPFPWVCLAALFGVFAFIPLLAAGESSGGMVEIEAQRQERLRKAAPVSPSQIKELAELKDAGLLSETEYEEKRVDLLQRL
jgi:cytochrome c-type biogenesis protein CcmH/NrfG